MRVGKLHRFWELPNPGMMRRFSGVGEPATRIVVAVSFVSCCLRPWVFEQTELFLL